MLVFAFAALLTIVIPFLSPPQPLPADEGTGAHIFQLSIALGRLCGLAYLMTADWAHTRRAAVPALVATVAVAVAFALLYYLEHVYHV